MKDNKQFLFNEFEKIIKDGNDIRKYLQNGEIDKQKLDVIKTRISNNKAINVACNGILQTVRLDTFATDVIAKYSENKQEEKVENNVQ